MSSVASRAVRNSTGVRLPSARRRRHTSKPSRSGSITSSTTRSGATAATASRASRPVGRRRHLEAVVAQGGAEHRAQVVLVVDDQEMLARHARRSVARRSVNSPRARCVLTADSRRTLRRAAMSRTETGAGRVLPHRRRRPDVGTDTVKGSQRVRSSGRRARRRRSFEPGGKHGEAGPRRVRSRRRAHRGGRAQDLGRRPARGDRDRPPGRRADGLAQGRPHPAAPQPARRLRLPRLRLARAAPHVALRVLRERRQGRRRGGHRPADHTGVLRRALDRRRWPARPTTGSASRAG